MALLVVMASWGWSGGGEWLTLEEIRRRQWEAYWRSVEECHREWEVYWRSVEEERTRRAVRQALAWQVNNAWVQRLWEEARVEVEERRRLRGGSGYEDSDEESGAAAEVGGWWLCCWRRWR